MPRCLFAPGLAWLLVCSPALVAQEGGGPAPAAGQPAAAAGADPATPAVDPVRLRREIALLEQVFKLKLDRGQATALLPEMEKLRDAQAARLAVRRATWAEAAEAAIKLEYALLRGERPERQQVSRVQAAERKYQQAQVSYTRQVDTILATVGRLLRPDQQALIGTDEQIAQRNAALAAQRASRTEAVQAASRELSAWARTAPEAEFAGGLAGKVAAVVGVAYPGLAAAQTAPVEQRLQALYREVRRMQPREFNEFRRRVNDALTAALPPLAPGGLADILMSRGEFVDWLADPVAATLLSRIVPHLAGG